MAFEVLALAVAVLVGAGTAGAAESAREILDRRKQLEDTTRKWDDRYQKMKMKIRGRRGERRRELEIYERRYPGDEQKAIVFFLAPAEVRGTGLLAYSHRDRPAEQWLYLPALKRVRQITASARKESFVGTDLTYHDLDLLSAMGSWTEDDAASRLRGEESIDGVACHVIELDPQRDDIGYGRIVLWLGRDDLVPRQVEFYEADDAGGGWLEGVLGTEGSDTKEPVKRIRESDVRWVGPIPVAFHIDVETPAVGTRTEIELADVQFNRGLEDRLFSRRSLERGRK